MSFPQTQLACVFIWWGLATTRLKHWWCAAEATNCRKNDLAFYIVCWDWRIQHSSRWCQRCSVDETRRSTSPPFHSPSSRHDYPLVRTRSHCACWLHYTWCHHQVLLRNKVKLNAVLLPDPFLQGGLWVWVWDCYCADLCNDESFTFAYTNSPANLAWINSWNSLSSSILHTTNDTGNGFTGNVWTAITRTRGDWSSLLLTVRTDGACHYLQEKRNTLTIYWMCTNFRGTYNDDCLLCESLRFYILSGVVQIGCRIMQWKTSFCMQCLSTRRTQTSLNDFPHHWNTWGPLMANRSALSVIVATTMETNMLFASRTYVFIPGKCDCIPG